MIGRMNSPAPDDLLQLMPFAVATGIQLDRVAADEVAGHLAWSPERCTAGFVMHGGALMTLADTVGAVCAYVNLPSGATTSTVASSTAFMRAVRSGTAHAVARPQQVGRSFITVLLDVTDDERRPVAQAQAVLAD
jgi:uncharacterized protein (TIGR00369 family)